MCMALNPKKVIRKLMENQTSIENFEIVAFYYLEKNRPVFFALFFFIYLIGLLGNIIIIITVITDVSLHKPMYIFLTNSSSVDIIFTSSTLPKLMDILLTGNNSISFVECFAQMCLYTFAACTEDMLLSFMAYDRYVAICKPLYYHMIMNRRNYMLVLVSIWISTAVDSLFLTLTIYQMNICHSNKIQQFFCELKAFDRILCNSTKLHLIIVAEVIIGLILFLLSLISYIKIISLVLSISSTTGQKKAFSTCTSHLTVLGMFYGAGMCMYLKPPSEQLEEQDLVLSTLFSAVTPMLNPIMYSLRNEEVKLSIKKIITLK
ncbi:olfactory receptor 1G1-like [Bufo gargarizans]|uniref:olfactory receptor 1G1-like n=1 Tax=Bufo gargarizans TaxID=30331 RepID=UPI001CF2A231|nr:olfactory receptor 1G1-like [Bufo gargarizans]